MQLRCVVKSLQIYSLSFNLIQVSAKCLFFLTRELFKMSKNWA